MARMNKLNKKGIELSVNFLVSIIIILVIFSGSVLIIRNFFINANEIQNQLDTQTQNRIRELLNNDDIVVVFDSRRTIQQGEGEIFGVGVWNLGSQNDWDSFNVKIRCDIGYNRDEDEILCEDTTSKNYFDVLYDDAWSIQNNEKTIGSVRIGVKKGTPSGTYIFNVKICREGAQSDDAG